MLEEQYCCSDIFNIKILPNLRPIALQTSEIIFSSILGHQGVSGITVNDLIISERLIRCFGHLKHQNPSTSDFYLQQQNIFLVQFLANSEAVVPLAHNPIMLERLIPQFRHLKHQNMSIISEFIARARMVQQFQRRSWIRVLEYS